MTVTCVIGVDPGLVDTGMVEFIFTPSQRTVTVEHWVFQKDPVQHVKRIVDGYGIKPRPYVFVEKYQPRAHLSSDARMLQLQAELRLSFPCELILNTGVKKIVRRPLMDLLGCWSFTTKTNHQDLRSAARIALYGMLKDEQLNALIATVVSDHLKGDTWHVQC